MKLSVIGNFFGFDGYSNHTKNLARALNRLDNVEVSVRTNKPQNWHMLLNDEDYEILNRDFNKSNVNLMIGMPHQWQYYLCENKKFIGFLIFEGDKIPKYWIDYLLDERVNQVWVPSQHVKDAILNISANEYDKDRSADLKIEDKLKIVPHGVDTNIFKPIKTNTNDKLTFFTDKGFRGELDRGGIQYLLRAYMEEFNEDDNVELVIKINPSYGTGVINNIINKYAQEINPTKKYATISISEKLMDYKELNEFYNKGDVFCITSMSEAFHLGGLQSLACGKPVLYTTFGGQNDYLNEKVGWKLEKGEMINIKWDMLYEEVNWKKPSIEEIRKKLRYIYNNQKEIKNKSKETLNISNKYKWNDSAQKAKPFLKELEQK